MSTRLVLVLIAVFLGGCFKIYSPEVQQGNLVSQEMIDALKPGMTRAQVRAVLGTPLVTDPFHADRWDYVYLYKKSHDAPSDLRRLTVVFDGDILARTEGDVVTASPSPGAGQTPAEQAAQTPADPAAISHAL